MSMRVLIVPEDFRKDQYLLKPLFARLFRSLRRQIRRKCPEDFDNLAGRIEAVTAGATP